MKKIRFISYILIIMFFISGFSSVKAAEIQNDSISIEKTITNYVSFESDEGGEINLKISNIQLDKTAKYKYKIKSGEQETAFYEVKSIDADNNIMNIEIEKSKSDILSILRTSDEAYLTIQETNAENNVKNIVENKKIDISLNLSKAFKVGHWATGYHGIAHTYGINEIYYKYEKVQDEDVVKKYLDYLNGYDSNKDDIYWGYYVDNLIDEMNIENNIPKDGWKKLQSRDTDTQPSEEGLYFIWMKAPKTSTNKELIGCVFSKRFKEKTVIENQLKDIQEKKKELTATVTYNPTSNTTGKVTATITANKKVKNIEGWTLSSDGKSLTKAYTANTTETVHLEDEYGMTKDVLVKVTNIIDRTQKPTSEPKDDTIATGKLPQTGTGIALGVTMLLISLIGCIGLIKYKSYGKLK